MPVSTATTARKPARKCTGQPARTISPPATGPKLNPYERITALIVSQLEKGVIPWKKPWKILLDGTIDVPRNYVTKKAYRGLNAVLLSCNEDQRPYYLTYRQATELGGQVRKGAKGQMILFYKLTPAEDADTEKEKTRFYEQVSYVFNVADIDGIVFALPELTIPDAAPVGKQIPACEAVIGGFPAPSPRIVFDDPERACYSPALDRVNMPRLEAFRSVEEYYKVFFHELAHATGHQNRLNRPDLVASGGWVVNPTAGRS